MEVPAIFRDCGLASKDEVWIVDKAVYGLTTSPKDWGVHRDGMFKKMMWSWEDEEAIKWNMKFEVTEEPNLWRIVGRKTEGENMVEEHMGFMSIYVDDVLMAARQEVKRAAVERIEKEWPLANLEWPMEEEPLRYCGFEIWEALRDGFDLKQEAYEELVEKWGVQVEVPIFKLREALATGGLWLATKTRPGGRSGDHGEHEDPEAGGGHWDDAAEVCERHERRGGPLHEGVGVGCERSFEREAA